MLNTDRLCLGCMNDNGGEQVCSICGYDSATQNPGDCLPTKFWLNDRYLVGRMLQKNSEGTVYIGWDNAEDSIVQIREYFPAGAALRNPDKTVAIADGMKYIYNEALMDFLELNHRLQKSELPSLIPIKAVFEENGTAYAVSVGFSGINLQDFLIRNGGTLKWEQARPLFLPLIDTLIGLHELGIYHGGISPETILVGRDGKLRLDGICIAKVRDAHGELPAQLFPGFAALEQYETADGALSENSDVYAISATLFRILIGTVPPEAPGRIGKDTLSIPARFAEELPHPVLVALANGLQVKAAKRTASIETFRNELVYGETAGTPKAKADSHPLYAPEETNKPRKPEKQKASGAKYAVISAACTTAVFLIIAGIISVTALRGVLFGKDDAAADSASEFVSIPSVPSIGAYDSDAAEQIPVYTVPDLSGKYYSQLSDLENYDKFQFVIKGKEYSSKYARGTICGQTVTGGTDVQKGTTVQLTISLGPQEIKIAKVIGSDADQAKLELLKQGFLYENIEVVDMYDSAATPNTVLEQQPEYGTVTNTEITVRIYVNTYEGDESDGTDTGLFSGSSVSIPASN